MNKTMMALAACGCLMLTACGDDEPQRVKYESVDLGLSVKWATMNVGAQKPEDHGQIFGWADSTGTHKNFDDIDIMYRTENDGSETTIVRWNSVYFGGKNPQPSISGSPYDIAIYHWNSNWRMPTMEEWNELMERCTWTVETTSAGAVYRVTGPNDNSIILPMTGLRTTSGGETEQMTTRGNYWTASLLPRNQQASHRYESEVACAAWCVQFTPNDRPRLTTSIRCYGMAVRPVAR